MHRIFRKDQVLTIPNLLSVIRLALIPLIVWLYIGKQEYSAAVAVILISGATDIIDGFIARKFNMVSDLGKILDPVADKLTQATVILCLTVKYRWMRGLIVLFVVKEIIMAVLGYMAIQKKDVVNSAKWYGKLNTVVLYLVMTCLILFPSISETVANVLIGICICVMLMSLTLYIRFYLNLFRTNWISKPQIQGGIKWLLFTYCLAFSPSCCSIFASLQFAAYASIRKKNMRKTAVFTAHCLQRFCRCFEGAANQSIYKRTGEDT